VLDSDFQPLLDTLATLDNLNMLKWIALLKNESMSKRPFQLPQDAQTISKYSGLSQHFLYYITRTAPVNVDEEETETGVYFTLRQRVASKGIYYIASSVEVGNSPYCRRKGKAVAEPRATRLRSLHSLT